MLHLAKNILVVHLRYFWKRSDNIKQMRNGNSQSNAFHTEYEILIEISTSFTYLDFLSFSSFAFVFLFRLENKSVFLTMYAVSQDIYLNSQEFLRGKKVEGREVDD